MVLEELVFKKPPAGWVERQWQVQSSYFIANDKVVFSPYEI